MAEIELTDTNFKPEVLQSQVPVLVDFWAPWCGPCRIIEAAVEQIAREYEGRLKVGKLNVDEAQSVAADYGILNLPTLAIFKKGKVVDRIIGAVPKHQLDLRIRPHLDSDSD